MIRRIGLSDITPIAEFLVDFQQESPHYRQFPADVNYTASYLDALAGAGVLIGSVLVVRDQIRGLVLGVVSKPWYSPVLMAQEMILYIDPAWRGSTAAPRLIYDLESAAREHNAQYLLAGSTAGINDAGVGRLYERMDFSKTPTGYMKGLT